MLCRCKSCLLQTTSVVGSVSELSDIQVESKDLADIMLKIPSKKSTIKTFQRLSVKLLC